MKHIRAFTVALALVSAAAFSATPPAMAGSTILCSSNEGGEERCTSEHEVAEVHYESANTKILTNMWTLTCKSLFLGQVGVLASPLIISGHFTYSECKREGQQECEVEEVQKEEGLLKLLKTGVTEGTFSGEIYEIKVKCPNQVNCVYDFEGLGGGAKSANLPFGGAKLTINEQTLHKVSGTLCIATTKLDMNLEASTDLYLKP